MVLATRDLPRAPKLRRGKCDVQQICSSDHPFLPIGNSGTEITCLRRTKESAPRRKGESGSLYAESLWAECTMMMQGNLGGL
jgi:hypothetical protein